MGSAQAVFAVTLDKAADKVVTVDYATQDGTGVAGVDYDATNGTVVFQPGETSKPVAVTVYGAAGAVANRAFTVNLSAPSNATMGSASGTCTLVENAALFTTVQAMKDNLWGFIQRATGAAATAAGIPPLVTAEGLVKNNQFVGGALGGYTADGVCSSEGIALMMRGVVSAYLGDNDPAKLAYAKFLFNSACTYFFYNTRPGAAASPLWHHSWMVNGGGAFDVRGPIPANGDLAQTGYIGEAVTFTAGVGQLAHNPDVLYQVVTAGTVFVWKNVFSDIAHDPTSGLPTGSNVAVSYYIDKDGNRVHGTQKGGSFGQPIEADSGETPGKVVLSDTSLNGTYLVNYCVTVPDVRIPYGSVYEAWPMWRQMYDAERSTAGDAIHWFTDCFRNLAAAEPANADWTNAQARILDVWQMTCTQESNGLNIFKGGADGPYNSYPLSYSYAYGVLADGTTQWNDQPPTTRYTAARTTDGYVTFSMPKADGTAGADLRYGIAFECQSLFLSYGSGGAVSVDLKTSVAQNIQFQFQPHQTGSEPAPKYFCTIPITPSTPTPFTVPMSAFKTFTGYYWTADRQYFTFGNVATLERKAVTLDDGSVTNSLHMHLTIPDGTSASSGVGVDRQNAFPYAEWTSPPGIYYASAGYLSYCLKDAAGWQWKCAIPPTRLIAYVNGKVVFSPIWSWFKPGIGDLTLDPYVTGTGPTPSVPALGPGQVVQAVIFQPGVPADGEMYLIYIADAQPVSPPISQQNIDIFTIIAPSTDAFTLAVADVVLQGGTRTPIDYYGALPFGLQINGPSRSRVSAVPYRGPYIAGYQSGTPWVDIGDDAKLGAMLDFMLESQAQFTQRSPSGIAGPFMHCYLPATWDSLQTGAVDTWVFDAPDGNPAWTGWQWRAFDAMAHTWYLAAQKGLSSSAKARLVATAFLTWLHGWLAAHPDAVGVPSDWGPPGWAQGQPFPVPGYLDPKEAAQSEPHDIALAMKAAIICGAAGADAQVVKDIVARCIPMLQAVQVDAQTSAMRGAFTHDPDTYQVYGFQQGEILDALGHALRFPQFIPAAT